MKKILILIMTLCVFAACERDIYVKVSFDLNYENDDGEIWVYTYLYQKGTIINNPGEILRDNYFFDGWYTDKDTFTEKWNFSNTVSEDITLYAKWREAQGIIEFTSSAIWVVPAGVTTVNVFCVGGGGSGAGDFTWANRSGSGGNGGVVTDTTVLVTPGKSIQITVGAGGIGGKRFNGTQGGSSSFGNLVISPGGYGGVDGQPDEQENSGRGGSSGLAGGDGIECSFYSTGEKYGAGGAGANTAYGKTSLQVYGGDTGGGNSGYGEDNTPQNRGSNATFYGGGGGGGAFSSDHTYSLGGNGSAGIVIIRY